MGICIIMVGPNAGNHQPEIRSAVVSINMQVHESRYPVGRCVSLYFRTELFPQDLDIQVGP